MPHSLLLNQLVTPTLLVVEDNGGDRRRFEIIAQEITNFPFRLRSATSLAEAVMAVEDNPPTLIVLDLGLPDSGGLVTLTRLRHAVPAIPIIVLTGNEEEQLAISAVREGAQDFLVKARLDAWGLSRSLRYALERQRLTDQLEAARADQAHRATHDGLTTLPNRILFNDRLNQAVIRSSRHNHRLAVVFLDLDGFKPINDRLGHAAGDDVLVLVARRLGTAVRACDTLARLGGDEFAVLFEQIIDQANATMLAEALRTLLSEPFEAAGERFSVGASLGVAIFPLDGRDPAALLRQADARMYADKVARQLVRGNLRLA